MLAIEEEAENSNVRFKFPQVGNLGTKGAILRLTDVAYKYPNSKDNLFSHVTMDFDMESRVFILVNTNTKLSFLFKNLLIL